jgi:hypothetical protein
MTLPSGAVCRTCGAPIAWVHTRTGMSMPVDPEPVLGGNLVIDVGLVATYVEPAPGQRLHVSHLATCPDATTHRRPSKAGRSRT